MPSFLSRRTLHRRSDALQPLITFRLQQVWFALPIQVAQRVVPLGQVYGHSANGSLSLTHYQNQEIVVLDIRSRVFSHLSLEIPPANEKSVAITTAIAQPHLLIVDYRDGELVGIRLDTPPVLRRVPRSAFSPVPATYLLESGIRCVSALVTPAESEPLFFLNLEQLFEVRSLPASVSPLLNDRD
jgi:chemotaxis signal transduction protein